MSKKEILQMELNKLHKTIRNLADRKNVILSETEVLTKRKVNLKDEVLKLSQRYSERVNEIEKKFAELEDKQTSYRLEISAKHKKLKTDQEDLEDLKQDLRGEMRDLELFQKVLNKRDENISKRENQYQQDLKDIKIEKESISARNVLIGNMEKNLDKQKKQVALKEQNLITSLKEVDNSLNRVDIKKNLLEASERKHVEDSLRFQRSYDKFKSDCESQNKKERYLLKLEKDQMERKNYLTEQEIKIKERILVLKNLEKKLIQLKKVKELKNIKI